MASAVRVFTITFVLVFCSLVTLVWTINWWKGRHKVLSWLEDNDLEEYYPIFLKAGVDTIEQIATTDLITHVEFKKVPKSGRARIKEASTRLADTLILQIWLKEHSLQRHKDSIEIFGGENFLCVFKSNSPNFRFTGRDLTSLTSTYSWCQSVIYAYSKKWQRERLIEHGYINLDKISQIHMEFMDIIGRAVGLPVQDMIRLADGAQELRRGKKHLKINTTKWRNMIKPSTENTQNIEGILVSSIIIGLLFMWVGGNYQVVQSSGVRHRKAKKSPFLDYFTGSFLDPNSCEVVWGWEEPVQVGDTMSFKIKFYQRNGIRYPITMEDRLNIEIMIGQQKVASSVEYGGTDLKNYNEASVAFTVRRAGVYNISIRLGSSHIISSPFKKIFQPGPVEPSKTGFIHHSSTVVATQNQLHALLIEPRDQYGNVCEEKNKPNYKDDYCIQVTEIGTSDKEKKEQFHPYYDLAPVFQSNCLSVFLKIEHPGCFKALATYKGIPLTNGDFNILVLSETDTAKVQKNVKKKNVDSFEATLLATNNDRLRRPKKVYCYVSPKQITIKEFYLKVIPRRLHTFRVCPATKFHFSSSDKDIPEFSIEDSSQPSIHLASKHRDILAATYTKFLLTNIGGSETFNDKQRCFNLEVVKLHHSHRKSSTTTITIDRRNLIESSIKNTKNVSTSDWCKKFEITFTGEEGQDWGGLMREWIELVCVALFSPDHQLFRRFHDSNQGLVHPNSSCLRVLSKPKWYAISLKVHPNSNRPPHLNKLKYFEFAGKIVGKCLYESACGSYSRQLVKARFSRSFLAQLIGLRINHKYFETDDPDFYTTKVRYIVENDVEDMELTFSEEVFNSHGKLEQVVELMPGGASIAVTNENKIQYLDLLAQHRLANSVHDEIEAFLKGLNDLIPDNLLSMFDENELELLMCGTCAFSVSEMRANYMLSGAGCGFAKVVDWFWTVVTSFTQEEMARLLQFTTGCSQLPPGGFAELNPKFTILAAPTHGVLPTAHTCFNQLCLPTYDSIEHLQKALVLAINEGSEGFGLI